MFCSCTFYLSCFLKEKKLINAMRWRFTWVSFKRKCYWMQWNGVELSENGSVESLCLFVLECVINFEGLVILKLIRKVCQTISLQEILQSIFIKLMALIFPMSILIQGKFYTFVEYELIEKIMGALWRFSFSAPFQCDERRASWKKRVVFLWSGEHLKRETHDTGMSNQEWQLNKEQ